MPYKVNNRKNGDGEYVLSYGRCLQKLTDVMVKYDERTPTGDLWGVPTRGILAPTMRECKVLWGQWAEENYETGGKTETEETPAASSPTPPDAGGPPAFKRSEDGPLTAISVLDNLYHWIKRNEHLTTHPETGGLKHPFDGVVRVLQRDCPDEDYPTPHKRPTNGRPTSRPAPSREPAASEGPRSGPPTFQRPATLGQLLASTGAATIDDPVTGQPVPDEDIPF